MSVEVFRGEGEGLEQKLVEPKRLTGHLKTGWRLEKYPEDVVVVNKIEDETGMLQQMNILPSIHNVIIGATCVPV
jgi:hypothetical protein